MCGELNPRKVTKCMSNLRRQISFEKTQIFLDASWAHYVCNLIQNPLYILYMLFAEKTFLRAPRWPQKSKSMKSLPELNRNPCFVATSKASAPVGKILESTFFSPSVLEEGKTRRRKKTSDSSSSIHVSLGGGEMIGRGKKANYFTMIWGKTVLFWSVPRAFGRNRLAFGSLSLLSATISRKSYRKKYFTARKPKITRLAGIISSHLWHFF